MVGAYPGLLPGWPAASGCDGSGCGGAIRIVCWIDTLHASNPLAMPSSVVCRHRLAVTGCCEHVAQDCLNCGTQMCGLYMCNVWDVYGLYMCYILLAWRKQQRPGIGM